MYAQIVPSAFAMQLTLQRTLKMVTYALLQTNHETCHKNELPWKECCQELPKPGVSSVY